MLYIVILSGVTGVEQQVSDLSLHFPLPFLPNYLLTRFIYLPHTWAKSRLKQAAKYLLVMNLFLWLLVTSPGPIRIPQLSLYSKCFWKLHYTPYDYFIVSFPTHLHFLIWQTSHNTNPLLRPKYFIFTRFNMVMVRHGFEYN